MSFTVLSWAWRASISTLALRSFTPCGSLCLTIRRRRACGLREYSDGTLVQYLKWIANTYHELRYYSLLFLADLVANVPSAKVYQVTELESDYLALYAVYSGKKLSKLAALNLNFYNNTSVARPSQKLDVNKLLGRDVTVKRFTGATSDVTGGVTWAGQSFDKGPADGKMKVERVKNGVVEVLASEGVIIERR